MNDLKSKGRSKGVVRGGGSSGYSTSSGTHITFSSVPVVYDSQLVNSSRAEGFPSTIYSCSAVLSKVK